jgi:hypothetical protein
MTFKEYIQVLTGAILLIVAARQIVQLCRHPKDPALRALVAGLVCIAVDASMFIPTITSPYSTAVLGRATALMLVDVLWIAMAGYFALFFLCADTETTTARQRGRQTHRELLLLAMALVIETGGRHLVPFAARPDYWRSWYCWVLLPVSIYVIAIAYVGVRRGILYRRTVAHLWLRRALAVVLAGASAMTLGVNVNTLLIDATHAILGPRHPQNFPILDVVYSIGQLGGQMLVAIGLVLPALATAATGVGRGLDLWQRRRYRRRMLYLWRQLTGRFPYIVLAPSTMPSFGRCSTEISDGLARLAPYCRHYSDEPTELEPDLAAELIAEAFEALATEKRTGEPVSSTPPYPQMEPSFAGWRERARWMAQVSTALHHQLGDVASPTPLTPQH